MTETTTNQGKPQVVFTDKYGHPARLTDMGDNLVIGCDEDPETALNRDDVEALAARLTHWLATGSIHLPAKETQS